MIDCIFPVPAKGSPSLDQKIGARAPFFLLFKALTRDFEKSSVDIKVLYRHYCSKHMCSMADAQKIFYLEQNNFNFDKTKNSLTVRMKKHVLQDYTKYKVITVPYGEDRRCKGITLGTGLRCGLYKNKGDYCKIHHPNYKKLEKQGYPKVELQNRMKVAIISHTDPMILKSVCLEMLRLYPAEFTHANKSSKERFEQIKIEMQISEYEQAIATLKGKLEETK